MGRECQKKRGGEAGFSPMIYTLFYPYLIVINYTCYFKGDTTDSMQFLDRKVLHGTTDSTLFLSSLPPAGFEPGGGGALGVNCV